MAIFEFHISFKDGEKLVIPEGVQKEAEDLLDGPPLFPRRDKCPFHWPVELVSDGDGVVAMEEGWPEFVGENHIEEGDHLFVKYTHFVFSVQVYAQGNLKELPDASLIEHATLVLPDPEDRAHHTNIPKDFGDAVFDWSRHSPKVAIPVRISIGPQRWTLHVKKYCPGNAVQYKTIHGWQNVVRDNAIQPGNVLVMQSKEVARDYLIALNILSKHGMVV